MVPLEVLELDVRVLRLERALPPHSHDRQDCDYDVHGNAPRAVAPVYHVNEGGGVGVAEDLVGDVVEPGAELGTQTVTTSALTVSAIEDLLGDEQEGGQGVVLGGPESAGDEVEPDDAVEDGYFVGGVEAYGVQGRDEEVGEEVVEVAGAEDHVGDEGGGSVAIRSAVEDGGVFCFVLLLGGLGSRSLFGGCLALAPGAPGRRLAGRRLLRGGSLALAASRRFFGGRPSTRR